MTHTELVIVGLGSVGIGVGLLIALVAGSGNRKAKSAPVLSFAVSVGRVVFAGGLALFIGSFASVLHEPLGAEVDLAFALAGKGLGIAAALLGGYAEEHAKHSLARVT